MKLQFAIFAFLVGVAGPTFALNLEINNQTNLELGHGVDPLTEQSYENCIDHGPAKFEDGSSSLKPGEFTAGSLPVTVEQIKSFSQMSKYSSTSISAGVSYSFASGGFSHADAEHESLYSDEAAIGIDLSADYGRWFLTSVRIKPEYVHMSDKEFRQRCGSEFIAGYRLGQGIRVKMSATASAASSYSQVTDAIHAAVSDGAFGANIAGAFSQAASSLMTASALQINILAYGAGPLQSVSGAVRTEDDATKFRNIISEYVEQLKPRFAVKTYYITEPYPGRPISDDPLLMEVKRQTIRSLYSDFLLLLTHKNRLESAVRSGRLQRFLGNACDQNQAECDSYIQRMKEYRTWVTSELEKIRNLAQKCINGSRIADCQTDPESSLIYSHLQHIIWPDRFRYMLMQAALDQIQKR